MPLPALKNWDTTAHSLHRAAQLLGTLRLLLFEHVPNYLEIAMKVRPEGLSSDVLPGGTEVSLDFKQAAMVVRFADGKSRSIPLAGHNQATLFEALLDALKTAELVAFLENVKDGALIDGLFTAIGKRSFVVTPKREDLTDTRPFDMDLQTAGVYADALYQVFTGIARFRARLFGMMTPAVVWPEHFDLSFLWFAGEQADEHKPHMNFGFAPFSPGFDLPYLYTTAWPLPDDYSGPQLPSYARWNTEGWRGVVVPYEVIARANDPASLVEDTCLAIYKALLPVIHDKA